MSNSQVQDEDEINSDLDEASALTPKQEAALQALLLHQTTKEAAHASGISETTMWRYMQDVHFVRRLREVSSQATSHAALRLQKLSSDAVTVLENLMNSEKTPPAARISAAWKMLDFSLRCAEIDKLQTRIEELEEFIRMKQEGDALDSVVKK